MRGENELYAEILPHPRWQDKDAGGSRRYRKKPDYDLRGMRKMGALILFLIVTAVCLVLDRDLFFS